MFLFIWLFSCCSLLCDCLSMESPSLPCTGNNLIVFFTGRLQQSQFIWKMSTCLQILTNLLTEQIGNRTHLQSSQKLPLLKHMGYSFYFEGEHPPSVVSHSFAWWLVSECLQTNGILNTNYRWLSAGDQINHEQILGLPPPRSANEFPNQQPDRQFPLATGSFHEGHWLFSRPLGLVVADCVFVSYHSETTSSCPVCDD